MWPMADIKYHVHLCATRRAGMTGLATHVRIRLLFICCLLSCGCTDKAGLLSNLADLNDLFAKIRLLLFHNQQMSESNSRLFCELRARKTRQL